MKPEHSIEISSIELTFSGCYSCFQFPMLLFSCDWRQRKFYIISKVWFNQDITLSSIFFGVLVFIFCCLFMTCVFLLIVSALIDTETCPHLCCKLSLGRIQTIHMDLLSHQVCGRLCWGYQLGVHTCLHQLIVFLYLKFPSNYFSSFIFFSTCVYCIYWISVLWSWNFSSGVL